MYYIIQYPSDNIYLMEGLRNNFGPMYITKSLIKRGDKHYRPLQMGVSCPVTDGVVLHRAETIEELIEPATFLAL